MTTGERTFSTKDRKITKPAPIPEGTYDVCFRTSTAEAANAKAKEGENESDTLPYVKVQLEVMNTALTEGGKNRVVFPMFQVSLKPNEKTGTVLLDGPSGLTALAKALGTDLEGIEIVTRTTSKGDEQEFLNPRQVADWINNKAGESFRARLKVTAAKNGYEASNQVQSFLPPQQ